MWKDSCCCRHVAKGFEGKGEACCPPMWRKEVMWYETERKGKMTKQMNRDDQLTATSYKQALYSRLGPGSNSPPKHTCALVCRGRSGDVAQRPADISGELR